MKKNIIIFLVFLSMVLVACSSSSDKPEPTSVPGVISPTSNSQQEQYSLNLIVNDQDGQPIPWASAVIQASGNSKSGKPDNNGRLIWEILSDSGGDLNISAQGYQPVQQPLSLEKGLNEITVVLELDPYQLNPASACLPVEKINYVEDFEDGLTQDIENISAPKWNLVDLNDRGFVLNGNAPGSGAKMVINSTFGNAVFKFDMMTSGLVDININWHEKEVSEGAAAGWSRYFVAYRSGERFTLNYDKPGSSGLLIETDPPIFEADSWHSFAIAYFQGNISVWVDGQEAMKINHDSPVESGKFGFQINSATEGEIWLDNLIVCSLSAVFTP